MTLALSHLASSVEAKDPFLQSSSSSLSQPQSSVSPNRPHLTKQVVKIGEVPIPSQLPPPPLCQRSSVGPRNRPPPRRVDHTYRDYSKFSTNEIPAGKKAPTNFPRKLHCILSNPEHSHIISWMPHGRAWKIHNKDLLMREVVPKFFVQSKYESFTRQLNGWGFKRLHQSGNDFNAYYHEMFLKGLVHLTALMRRVTPNKGKLLPHVEGEPNFYEIARQIPLPSSLMPSLGQHYSPSRIASEGYGYGPPPEPITTTGHISPGSYSSYPSSYPPPAPHRTDYQAAPAYPSQLDYPSYAAYTTRCSQPSQESYPQYPYCPPDPSYGTQYHYDTSPFNDHGPVTNMEVTSSTAPLVQDNGVPTSEYGMEYGSLEPLSIFTGAESSTTH